MGHAAVKFKKPAVFNQPRLLQRIAEIADVCPSDRLAAGHIAVLIRDIHYLGFKDAVRQDHRGGKALLVECEHVASRHPAEAGKNNTDAEDKYRIQHPSETAASGIFPALDRMIGFCRAVLCFGFRLIGPGPFLPGQMAGPDPNLVQLLGLCAFLFRILMDFKYLVDGVALFRHISISPFQCKGWLPVLHRDP